MRRITIAVLGFSIYVDPSRSSDEFGDCGHADLTPNFLAPTKHRKPERQTLVVVPQNAAPASAATKSPMMSKMLEMLISGRVVEERGVA